MGFLSRGSEFSAFTGSSEYWIVICPNDSSDEYMGAVFNDGVTMLEAAQTFASFLYSNGMEIYDIKRMKVVHSSERLRAHLN